LATTMEVKVSVIDMDLFEDVVNIMKDMYEVADEDTKAVVDARMDKMNEKYSDRVLPMNVRADLSDVNK